MYLLTILAQEAPQEIGNAFAIGRNIIILLQLLAFAGLGVALLMKWVPAIGNKGRRLEAKDETPAIFTMFGLVEGLNIAIAIGIWVITHNTTIVIPGR